MAHYVYSDPYNKTLKLVDASTPLANSNPTYGFSSAGYSPETGALSFPSGSSSGSGSGSSSGSVPSSGSFTPISIDYSGLSPDSGLPNIMVENNKALVDVLQSGFNAILSFLSASSSPAVGSSGLIVTGKQIGRAHV